MKKIFFSLATLALLTTSSFASTIVYDKASTPASIQIDQINRAQNAARVYPIDPTPAYMLTNVCSGPNVQGCTSGGGSGGGASSSGGE